MTSATSMTRPDESPTAASGSWASGWPPAELSAVELTQHYLQRIDEHNAELNAFITVDPEYSLAQAREADRSLAAGDQHHPLTGIPVALKDSIPTAGLRTTAGSRVLNDWVPPADPPVVQRLRSCGVVIIGKTNLHEFAYGGTSENEHFGPVRNPWDPRRVAGGSSGGRPPRWRRGSPPRPSAPTRPARYACPRASAARLGSSPATGASRQRG